MPRILLPEQIKESLAHEARARGFELFGVTRPTVPAEETDRLRAWLDRGDAARMASYLGPDPESRGDAGSLLPGARSVVMLGMAYAQPLPDLSRISGRPEGRIARFALGRDYHRVLGAHLAELAAWLAAQPQPEGAEPVRTKWFVDTAPVLERAFARQAGLGFVGKNNCLIHPRFGSWFLLGGLASTLELPFDAPAGDCLCGDCRRCLDACPGGALREAFHLDARRCVSYLTIETREAFSAEEARVVGDNLLGCDACQEACPYNTTPCPCAENALRPSEPDTSASTLDGGNATLEAILAIESNRAFDRSVGDSAMARPRRRGLQRNARAVACHLGREDIGSGPGRKV